jgi:DNA polymerase-3 subunit alpha
MKWGAAQREQAAAGQFSLFGAEEVAAPQLVEASELSELELLRFEKEALGLYISAHPMNSYPGLADAASCAVEAVERFYKQNQVPGSSRMKVALAGLLQSVVKRPTRRGGMMARFEVADESGAREVLAFGRTYDSVAPLLEEDVPVVAVVDVNDDGEGVRLVIDRLIRWDSREGSEGGVPEVALFSFDLAQVGQHQLIELRSLMDEHSGRTPVRFQFQGPGGDTLYQVDGARIDQEALEQLRSSCPWLKARLTVDRQALLADRGRPMYGGRPQAAAPDVPF